ncbi:D-alanyl-D-alanine endopeptidase [Leptothrix sp. BB-4]
MKYLRLNPIAAPSRPDMRRWLAVGAAVAGLLVAGQVGAAESAGQSKNSVRAKSAKVVPQRKVVRTRASVAPDPVSVGRSAGLQHTSDPLALKSNVAFVVDQDTSEVLFSKNPQAILPIASLTKLMTAMVVVESGASLDDELEITTADIDTEKGSSSRLAVGTRLTRGEMLHLALMSSENRAANALGRHHPGGLAEFVRAMNVRAASLGMVDTRYVEPTGLSSQNRSSAPDLARLVGAAYEYPLLRQFSTTPEAEVGIGRRTVQFNNTNRLVRNPNWEIGLQKTGYIAEAGRCLVMQAQMAGRKLIMVFLDSAGKYSRLGDAERVRQWIERGNELSAKAQARPLR